MSSSKKRHLLKITTLGDFGVGKTSLARQYAIKQFRRNYKTTIAPEFLMKEVIFHLSHGSSDHQIHRVVNTILKLLQFMN